MNRKFTCFVLIFFLQILLTLNLFGQELSTQGTEFYVSFMKNGYRGCNGSATNSKLTVIASAPRTCTVEIENPNTGWSSSGVITGGTMHSFLIPPEVAYNTVSEVVTNLGLKITSTDTISLFIANEATNSFDASIVLPTHALGERYITQNFTPSNSSSVCTASNNSCFVVIATEDSTIVDITPRKRTLGGHLPDTVFTITLNEGECYQVFSEVGETAGDLSGTRIESRGCKKIAVFNGNVLTGIPTGLVEGYDHIFEQAIPINYWGRHFIATASLSRSGDFVKITASEDNTQVKIDGNVTAMLNACESYEFYLQAANTACFIETSMPSAVYLYHTTSSYDNSTLGDPSMIWIAPVEQQISEIIFCTFAAQNISAHYVNIVMPAASSASIRLDGAPIAAGSIRSLTHNPEYSYARVPITNGTHRLSSNSTFFAFIYGFGAAQGYGYAVGAKAVPSENDILVNQQPTKQIPENFLHCPHEPIHFSIYAQYTYDTITWYLDDDAPVVAETLTHTFTDSGTYYLKAIVNFATSDCSPPFIDTLFYTINIGLFTRQISDTTCSGILYDENGFNFLATHDTTASLITTNQYNCPDSTILQLKVNPSYNIQITEHVEYEDIPFDFSGNSYHTTGNYTVSLSTDRGCDSILLLHLFVHQDYLFTEEASICEGERYIFRGREFTEEGIYYDSLRTILNDDSVFQLILHVFPTYHIIIEDTICSNQQYDFNGDLLASSGTYQANLLTQQQCDSLITLHLVVYDNYFIENEVYLCSPNFYCFRGDTLREAGVYVDSLQTAAGCDSVIRLSLFFVDPWETIIEENICPGEYYSKYGLQVPPHPEAGIYEYRFDLLDQYGCDSIVYLTLTVPDVRIEIVSLFENFCDTYSTTLQAITPNSSIEWNTGETTSTIDVNRPGIYQATVSEESCTARDFFYIEYCPFNLFLANAISPTRADGLNDYFFLANAAEVKELSITIYDQWGKVAFHSTDPYFRWDGKVDGKLSTNYVFNYIMFVTPIAGPKQKIKGSITVL